MKILPEAQWGGLLDVLCGVQGTVLLLGATDSGKTTLARYIIESLVARGRRAALIDSDIGQSALGLPGTISMKVFHSETDLRVFGFERMTFLGFTNPARVIPLTVAMTKRLAGIGRRRAGIAVVDTTGLISGGPGRALKMAKIKALRPEHIIAIQREDELEHILSLVEGAGIHRMKASSEAKKRSPSSRSAYRKRKLEGYFRAGRSEHMLDASSVEFFYRGRSFRFGDREMKHGEIIGLNRNGDTIALGIIRRVAGTAVSFRSPLRPPEEINRVVCGDMTMIDNINSA